MEQFAIQRLCLSSYVYLKQCFCLKAPFFKHTLAPVFSSHIVNKHGPFSLHIYFFVFFSSPFQFNTLLGAPVCCGSGSDGIHTTFSGCRFVIRICEEYKKKLENMLKFHTLRDLIFSDINNINSLLKKEFFRVTVKCPQGDNWQVARSGSSALNVQILIYCTTRCRAERC